MSATKMSRDGSQFDPGPIALAIAFLMAGTGGTTVEWMLDWVEERCISNGLEPVSVYRERDLVESALEDLGLHPYACYSRADIRDRLHKLPVAGGLQ